MNSLQTQHVNARATEANVNAALVGIFVQTVALSIFWLSPNQFHRRLAIGTSAITVLTGGIAPIIVGKLSQRKIDEVESLRPSADPKSLWGEFPIFSFMTVGNMIKSLGISIPMAATSLVDPSAGFAQQLKTMLIVGVAMGGLVFGPFFLTQFAINRLWPLQEEQEVKS